MVTAQTYERLCFGWVFPVFLHALHRLDISLTNHETVVGPIRPGVSCHPDKATSGRIDAMQTPGTSFQPPVQTGAAFVATNNGVQYSVSPRALVITRGSTVLSNEPMLEYWSD